MKRTVLYVEDEADDVLFMRVAFQRLGAAVDLRSVEDGGRAMAYLGGESPFADRTQYPQPDVLLLDLNLPLHSGFEVLQWLRDQPALAQLPVVIFSSSGRPEDRARAGAGCVGLPVETLLRTGLRAGGETPAGYLAEAGKRVIGRPRQAGRSPRNQWTVT